MNPNNQFAATSSHGRKLPTHAVVQCYLAVCYLAVCLLTLYCITSNGVAVGATTAIATQPGQRTFEGFTEPIQKIQVAAPESARVAKVVLKRGAIVVQGDVLIELDTKLLEASLRIAESKAKASSRIEALRIEQQMQDDRYTKIKDLHERGAGSPEEAKRAKADAAVAELNVQSALEEQALSELEVAEIQARIEQRRVRSPINGVVTELIHEPGEYVSLNEPKIATVVQLDTLRVTFFFPTDLAVSLNEGQDLNIQLPGVKPPETSQTAVGKIEHIAAVTEADSGRVRVDVLIANPNRKYRSGVRCMFVTQ